MRIFNILGIIGSIGIFWYCFHVANQIEVLYRTHYFETAFGINRSFEVGLLNIALNGGFMMILVALFYSGLYIANYRKRNTNTTKVLSLIGIILSSALLVFNVVLIVLYGAINFGLVYFVWGLFGMISLAFCIALLVQAIKAFRGPKKIEDEEEVLHEVDADFEIE